jgi:hypothetical protein
MTGNHTNHISGIKPRARILLLLALGIGLSATLSGCGILGAGSTASKTYIEIPQNTGPTAPN